MAVSLKILAERPELCDAKLLMSFGPGIADHTKIESCFITGLIRVTNSKNLLEVGVHNGGSSLVMLNAIRDNKEARLYSVDYSDTVIYGRNKGEKIGWAVKEHLPELAPQWHLFTGGHIAEFIDEMPRGIDLCFLDSAHQLPGEILDFLIILPYMQQAGLFIIHDTCDDHFEHHLEWRNKDFSPVFYLTCIANSVLFAVARGEKIKPREFPAAIFPTANIGALLINDDTRKYIDDLFWALNIKWRYLPSDKDMLYIVPILEKHYERRNVDMFLRNYELNKRVGCV